MPRFTCHRECNGAQSIQSSDILLSKYSQLVYNGLWFSPEREALQALVTETQRDVTGVVRLKLYKGNIIVAGRKSPKSLYDPKIAGVANTWTVSNKKTRAAFLPPAHCKLTADRPARAGCSRLEFLTQGNVPETITDRVRYACALAAMPSRKPASNPAERIVRSGVTIVTKKD